MTRVPDTREAGRYSGMMISLWFTRRCLANSAGGWRRSGSGGLTPV